MIKKNVGLVIVEKQRVLEKLLDLLAQMGRKYDSIGDDVIVVQLGLMGVMVVKVEVCSGDIGRGFYCNNKNTINGINNINDNYNDNKNHHLQTNTYLTKIKKTLLNQSNKSYLHLGK